MMLTFALIGFFEYLNKVRNNVAATFRVSGVFR